MISLNSCSSMGAFSMIERTTSMTSLRLRFENENLDMFCKEDLFKSNELIYEESSGVRETTNGALKILAFSIYYIIYIT